MNIIETVKAKIQEQINSNINRIASSEETKKRAIDLEEAKFLSIKAQAEASIVDLKATLTAMDTDAVVLAKAVNSFLRIEKTPNTRYKQSNGEGNFRSSLTKEDEDKAKEAILSIIVQNPDRFTKAGEVFRKINAVGTQKFHSYISQDKVSDLIKELLDNGKLKTNGQPRGHMAYQII